MKRMWPFLLAVVVFLALMAGILTRSYSDRLPGAGRMCEPGLGVAGGASCQLAVATRDRVAEAPSGAQSFEVQAFNPLTGSDLAFSCVRGEVVRCESASGEVVLVAP